MSDLISRQDVPDTNVGDMISRQETLRAFEEMCSCTDYGWDERDFRDLIKKMPSVEPEIIRCKDCKYGNPNTKYGCTCYHYRRYEAHEMSPNDFCSRAERRTDEQTD